MFELIIKDIMEVAGYLPIGILCGCIAVVVYLVYTVSPAGKKVSAGGRVKKVDSVVSAGGVSGGDGSYCVPVQRAGLKARH